MAITSNSSSAAGLAGRNVTQFIEDQQVQLAKLPSQSQELPFFFGFQQQSDQLGDSEEADLLALSTSSHAQTNGQVRLARTAGTDEQDVLPLVEVLTLNELQQQGLIDAGPGLEVELIEQLMRGETGGLQPPLRRLAFRSISSSSHSCSRNAR